MRICGIKYIFNGKNKTQEDESTLVNTIDNLFFHSFIINDGANIALRFIAIYIKTFQCFILLSKSKICTHMNLLKDEVVS